MFKQLFRKLLDKELGVLGEELRRLEAKNEDTGIEIDALKVRFERLQNRTGTRLTRAERRGELVGGAQSIPWSEMSDEEILEYARGRH